MTEAYRNVVLERDEQKEALRIIDEFKEFLNQKMRERYEDLIEKSKGES